MCALASSAEYRATEQLKQDSQSPPYSVNHGVAGNEKTGFTTDGPWIPTGTNREFDQVYGGCGTA
jgi:hypothetical protein